MILVVFLFLILLVLGSSLFLLRFGVKLRKRVQLIEREGRQVTGRLVKLTSYRIRGSVMYRAMFTYQVDGRDYTCERSITSKHYRAWSEGMPIELKYAASQPQDAYLVNDRSSTGWLWWLVGAAILLVATVVLIVIMIVMGLNGQLFL